MKFSSATLFAASLYVSTTPSLAEEDCTRGTLFISDVNSSTVRGYGLDGDISNLAVDSTTQAPGGNGQVLASVYSGTKISSMYRGDEAVGYTDGRVNFIDTSTDTPTIIENAGFDCARPIHYVNHDSKIALFCDGNFGDTIDDQVNTTVWVVDETLMGTAGSAIVFTKTLQGSHHGVTIPVDDNHVMYSVAAPQRVDRDADANQFALPGTFTVVDYDDNEIHSIDDTTDPSMSCSGFHGSAHADGLFALACDADHGGILVVAYEATTSAYTSRALSYPLQNHRTGGFADHPKSSHIVGNFAGENNEFHLLAFDPEDTTELDTETHIQTLDERQCSFKFEKSKGELLLVFLQSGHLQVYKTDPEWSLVVEMQVVEDMIACSDASMTVGYDQAFIMLPATQQLISLDLSEVEHDGTIEMFTSDLGFTPNSAIVSGVPVGEECLDPDHNHGSSSAFVAASLPGMVSMLAFAFGLWNGGW